MTFVTRNFNLLMISRKLTKARKYLPNEKEYTFWGAAAAAAAESRRACFALLFGNVGIFAI